MSTIFATGGTTFGTFFEDVIEGSEDFDQIFAGFGNDVVNGNGGDDSLQGGGDDDTVDGGAGNDNIEGGVGNDLLIGGLGADTFLFKPFSVPGQDIIADFNPLEDNLLFDLTGDA